MGLLDRVGESLGEQINVSMKIARPFADQTYGEGYMSDLRRGRKTSGFKQIY